MTEKLQPWQDRAATQKVYDSLQAAFNDKETIAVWSNDVGCIGYIAFAWGKNGGCRAWVHEFGYRVAFGRAGGSGYDLRGAALEDLFKKNSRHPSPLVQALRDVTYDGQWSTVLKEQGFHTQTLT